MLFAYGTINSGKTYTIEGTPSHPGLLPTLVEEILEVAAMTSRSSGDCELQISMLEIHQEKIHDLLCSNEKKDKLSLMDANGKISVSRLSLHVVDSPNDAAALINLATSRRLAECTSDAIPFTNTNKHDYLFICLSNEFYTEWNLCALMRIQ